MGFSHSVQEKSAEWIDYGGVVGNAMQDAEQLGAEYDEAIWMRPKVSVVQPGLGKNY